MITEEGKFQIFCVVDDMTGAVVPGEEVKEHDDDLRRLVAGVHWEACSLVPTGVWVDP